jgi:hypothetical protein
VTITLDPQRAAEVRSLNDLLDGIVERVVAGYEQAGVDLPERRYWTMQLPAQDCEQMVVAFVQAYVGPVGDEAATPQRCQSPRTAVCDVQVTRCIPGLQARGRAPSSEQIENAARALGIDAWLLLDLSASMDQWDVAGPGMGVIATVDVGEPEGGYQTVTLHLTLAIP